MVSKSYLGVALFAVILQAFGNLYPQAESSNQNIDSLIHKLQTGNEDERRYAAKDLGELEDTAAVVALIEALEDSSCYVRGIAAQSLGWIGDSRAVEPLIKRLSEIHVIVRGMAAYALGRIGDTAAVEPLIATLQKKTSPFATWLTTENYQREGAAWSLGEIGAQRAVEPLIDVLEDRDPDIRMNAALSLGKIQDPRAVEPLIKLAQKDDKDSIRGIAAWSLAEIGTEDAEVYLATALEKKHWPVIAGAYKFYIREGKPGTEDILIKALKKFGSQKIACTYAFCENLKLEEAARKWAMSHDVELPEPDKDSPEWGNR